jgi:N-acetylglucosamine kinase-like BadF-type ATPase
MAGMKYFLGVDGGQSSTLGLIADESGRVLGRGQAGPCNHVTGPEARAKFRSALTTVLTEACAQAGLDPSSIAFYFACLGFSGGMADKEISVRELVVADGYKVTHDAEIALIGATAGEPGIIMISGTGSIGFGRNAKSKSGRAGGWGYAFGDEGSGFDLTRQALRAALRFEEGWGPETQLRELLLRETNAASANDLLHQFYTPEFPRARIASLAGLVSEAADAGDHVAGQLLFDAASQLVNYVEGVHRQLFEPSHVVPIAYLGGVFKSHILLSEFLRSVQYRLGSRAQAPKYGPAAGALIEAMRLSGFQCLPDPIPSEEK